MIQGMTGFGSAEKGGFRVEVRSLNHRFLEIAVKMPPALGRYEMALRDAIRHRFERGKIDVYISSTGEEKIRLKVNMPLAKEVAFSLNSLKQELQITKDLSIEALLHWKELLMTEEVQYETDSLFSAFQEALSLLEAMRLNEGEAIKANVLKGAEKIESLNSEVISLCPHAVDSARQKFIEAVKAFLPGEADESKLIYEAGKAAEKADIKEEVMRIKSHLDYMRKILAEGDKIGRALDFILQELLREVNTIASKTTEHGIIKIAIDMKTEIEAVREQVQNIQ